MDKRDNPIQIVEIRNTVHRDPIPPGAIDDKVFGDGASVERRQHLASQTKTIFSHLRASSIMVRFSLVTSAC
jgi:hypothetical protein